MILDNSTYSGTVKAVMENENLGASYYWYHNGERFHTGPQVAIDNNDKRDFFSLAVLKDGYQPAGISVDLEGIFSSKIDELSKKYKDICGTPSITTYATVKNEEYTWDESDAVTISGACDDRYVNSKGHYEFPVVAMDKKISIHTVDESEGKLLEHYQTNLDFTTKVHPVNLGKAGIWIKCLIHNVHTDLSKTAGYIFFYRDPNGNIKKRRIGDRLYSDAADIPEDVTIGACSGPVYMRVQLCGKTLFFYTSNDGQTYTLRDQMHCPDAYRMGLAYSSGSVATTGSASFSDISMKLYPRVCIKRGIDIVRFETLDDAVKNAQDNDHIYTSALGMDGRDAKWTIKGANSKAQNVKLYLADYLNLSFEGPLYFHGDIQTISGGSHWTTTSEIICGDEISYNERIFLYDTDTPQEQNLSNHRLIGLFPDLCEALKVAHDGQTVEVGQGRYNITGASFVGIVGVDTDDKSKASVISLGFDDVPQCNGINDLETNHGLLFKNLWFEIEGTKPLGYAAAGPLPMTFRNCTFEALFDPDNVPDGYGTVPKGNDRSTTAFSIGTTDFDDNIYPMNGTMRIERCNFKNFATGMEIIKADNVYVHDCVFTNTKTTIEGEDKCDNLDTRNNQIN